MLCLLRVYMYRYIGRFRIFGLVPRWPHACLRGMSIDVELPVALAVDVVFASLRPVDATSRESITRKVFPICDLAFVRHSSYQLKIIRPSRPTDTRARTVNSLPL